MWRKAVLLTSDDAFLEASGLLGTTMELEEARLVISRDSHIDFVLFVVF